MMRGRDKSQALNIHSQLLCLQYFNTAVANHDSTTVQIEIKQGCTIEMAECVETWQPEFNPQLPHCRRREQIPEVFSLSSTQVLWCISTDANIETSVFTYVLWHVPTHGQNETYFSTQILAHSSCAYMETLAFRNTHIIYISKLK